MSPHYKPHKARLERDAKRLAEGCGHGHGPERMARYPDGLLFCRDCHMQYVIAKRAVTILGVPLSVSPLRYLRDELGADMDAVRLALRQLPSQKRQGMQSLSPIGDRFENYDPANRPFEQDGALWRQRSAQ